MMRIMSEFYDEEDGEGSEVEVTESDGSAEEESIGSDESQDTVDLDDDEY